MRIVLFRKLNSQTVRVPWFLDSPGTYIDTISLLGCESMKVGTKFSVTGYLS
jgi:hypothetical protein